MHEDLVCSKFVFSLLVMYDSLPHLYLSLNDHNGVMALLGIRLSGFSSAALQMFSSGAREIKIQNSVHVVHRIDSW
jgi:hypothetical protein